MLEPVKKYFMKLKLVLITVVHQAVRCPATGLSSQHQRTLRGSSLGSLDSARLHPQGLVGDGGNVKE